MPSLFFKEQVEGGMTRSELVKSILKGNGHLKTDEVESALDCFFETFESALSQDGRVELRDFGVLSIRRRASRQARNPRNGQIVSIPEKRYLHFKMSKYLRQVLNCTSL